MNNEAHLVPTTLVDMKMPHVRDLAHRLRFDPSQGRIWLDDVRMVLLQGSAFSSLREELIASLGMDTARGLLTRIGYASGCRDAQLAMRAASHNESLEDVMVAGAVLHALQGFTYPERIRRSSNRHDETYYAEWVWKDSIEDQGHIAAHGIGPDPACWNAIGYASGYITTAIGQRILVREVECKAQGHSECRGVAKPVSQWENAQEDLSFLEPQPRPSTKFYGGVQAKNTSTTSTPPDSISPSHLLGASAAFHVLRHKILRVAPTNASVLLLGESGVGKSLVARELHRLSQRADKSFVEVNCAAIPETLVESELFGVEKGAYSGATASRAGRFEAASDGTLFLDEIGTLSLPAQGKLLRVLQTGEFERLGSNRTIRTNVRLLAATNEDLKSAVQQGRFREDLFYRLNVFPILIQPLRERREDLPLLVQVLLERFSQKHDRTNVGITPRAMSAILHHDWPGNIRELENVLEHGMIMANEGEKIDVHHFQNAEGGLGLSAWLFPTSKGGLVQYDESSLPMPDKARSQMLDTIAQEILTEGPASLDEIESALVKTALRQARGNVSRAAPILGLTRAQMEYRVKKLPREELEAAMRSE